MPFYRRARTAGGCYFFTLITHSRRPILLHPTARRHLREAFAVARQAAGPFAVDAVVLLPDHLHLLCTLPAGDDGYAARLSRLKSEFTRRHLAAGGPEAAMTPGERREGHRGVWQRRYWEHRVRDDRDYENHLDYVVYNPVRHALCRCPHDWRHSSFERLVRAGVYERRWCCSCRGPASPPASSDMQAGE